MKNHRTGGLRRTAAWLALVLLVAACSTTGETTEDTAAEETDEAGEEETAATEEEPEQATEEGGSEAGSDTSGASEPSDSPADVQTGPGVTADEIHIAVLTDLSGPFAAGAAIQVAEFTAFWDTVNADGGICDRQIVMNVQDHTYDPQTAVSQYTGIADDTLAVQQLLGSPMIAALLPTLQEDSMYAGGMGWPSVVLANDVAQMPGAPYSIQSANAVDYMVEELGVAEGEGIGVIYFEGDYGEDSLAGAEFAADEHGLEVIGQPITPADTDLTGQVAALQQAGVSAVIIAAAPGQLGGYIGAAAAAGLDVPVFGNTPAYAPSLLDSPAGGTLIDSYYALQAVAPYASDASGPQQAVALYEENVADQSPGWEVPLAYGQALLLEATLRTACDNGDLTREGVIAAMRQTSDLDTEGIFPGMLDFTTVGEPPTRTVFISRPNPDVPGGLEIETEYEGQSAVAYTFN